jgi:hypothetical protein
MSRCWECDHPSWAHSAALSFTLLRNGAEGTREVKVSLAFLHVVWMEMLSQCPHSLLLLSEASFHFILKHGFLQAD